MFAHSYMKHLKMKSVYSKFPCPANFLLFGTF
uniref:Uncharacterized protein n=1 Tax=Anguilla anguilla TaxID=7936 RepID=A0A0E9T206_ANGAN